MKKTVSVIAMFLIATLLFTLLPNTISAQSLKTSEIPTTSPDFERIKKISLEFLDSELSRDASEEPKNTQFEIPCSVQFDELG